MKYVVACLTLVAMIFVAGCQENTVTSPITTADPAGLSSAAKLAEDVIFFNDEVLLKHVEAVDGIWILGGQAAYAMTPQEGGVKVDINVDCTIKPKYVSGDPAGVQGESSDLVEGIGSQPVILEKEYPFECGNGDQRILHINFAVSESYISVDEMWVVIPIGFGAVSAN